jgi:ABC-type multidrug transport system permease subunit
MAYARFQLGDYLLQRAAIAIVLVLFIAGLPLWGTLRAQPDFFKTQRGPFFAMQLYTGTVALFLPIGAFLAGAGIVSSDRHQGHFRFYFSKPIGVLAYYVQTYVLHGVVFVALFGAITWGWGALAVHVSVHRAMEAAALTFVLVGGIGLLLSTLLRFDGGLLVLVYIISMTLQQIAAMPGKQQLPGWALQLSKVLPPVYKMDQVRSHLYAAEAIAAADVWHVIGYGIGAFVLGLLLLRKLPLSR